MPRHAKRSQTDQRESSGTVPAPSVRADCGPRHGAKGDARARAFQGGHASSTAPSHAAAKGRHASASAPAAKEPVAKEPVAKEPAAKEPAAKMPAAKKKRESKPVPKSVPRVLGAVLALLVIAAVGLGVWSVFGESRTQAEGALSASAGIKETVRVQARAGYRSVALVWPQVDGAQGYAIHVDQEGEANDISLESSEASYTIEGLRGKIPVTITVSANVGGALKPIGDEAGVTATPTGPKAPESFMAIANDIVEACYRTPTTEIGWCAKWVNNVFDEAGHSVTRLDAPEMYYRWCTEDYSTDVDELVPGMVVAAPVTCFNAAGTSFGHVGIYVGDGKVMDSVGYVRTLTLEEWLEENEVYSDAGWGIAYLN